ncbi:hypothetical protein BN2497_1509 [Janthinobacterium sp. CG23_2]|nr:hypothetical protein BN2497_1509 [Janthinobacterium sp. CG23_2]CUU27152.1 hypothetical protein BN3177_1509 [Janthinobacterium sp. CG23_2]
MGTDEGRGSERPQGLNTMPARAAGFYRDSHDYLNNPE